MGKQIKYRIWYALYWSKNQIEKIEVFGETDKFFILSDGKEAKRSASTGIYDTYEEAFDAGLAYLNNLIDIEQDRINRTQQSKEMYIKEKHPKLNK